jgi:transcriptional regulator of aromatic amino acid metabolism
MADFDSTVIETRRLTARMIGEAAEKRSAALRALRDSQGVDGSTRKLADLLGVSHQTVATILRRPS